MLTVRTSENTVITSFRLISERQDFSSVRTGENTVRARARIHIRAGYLYNFSKRTLVYVQGAWGKAHIALNQAPGLSGWNTSVGVMHRF